MAERSQPSNSLTSDFFKREFQHPSRGLPSLAAETLRATTSTTSAADLPGDQAQLVPLQDSVAELLRILALRAMAGKPLASDDPLLQLLDEGIRSLYWLSIQLWQASPPAEFFTGSTRPFLQDGLSTRRSSHLDSAPPHPNRARPAPLPPPPLPPAVPASPPFGVLTWQRCGSIRPRALLGTH